MWQRAIEIGKSFPTGDGRDVIISKRSWENKHSTVLQGGKGRQEGVAGEASPPSIPDLQVWGGDCAVWMWAGIMKWKNPIRRTSRVLGKQRKKPPTRGRRTGPSPTQVLLLDHCLAPGNAVGRSPPMLPLQEYLGSISATNCYSEQSPERWCLEELDSPLENISGGHNLSHWISKKLPVVLPVGCMAIGKIVVCFCQVLFSLSFVKCKN